MWGISTCSQTTDFPYFHRAGLAHFFSAFHARAMVLVHNIFGPCSLNAFSRNTQPYWFPSGKQSLLRSTDTETLLKGYNCKHDHYLPRAQIKDAVGPFGRFQRKLNWLCTKIGNTDILEQLGCVVTLNKGECGDCLRVFMIKTVIN